MLDRLDSLLVDRVYQPIVNALRVHPLSAATSCACGLTVFSVLYIAVVLTVRERVVSPYLIVAEMFSVVVGLALMQWYGAMVPRKEDGRSISRLRETPFRKFSLVYMTWLLALDLLTLVFGFEDVGDVLNAVRPVLFVSAAYFAACDSPPPKRAVATRLAEA